MSIEDAKKWWYSPSRRGFYNDDVHDVAKLPPDAVGITRAEYDAVFAEQARGRRIVPGPDGKPIAVEVTETSEQRAARLIGLRNRLLAESDGLVARHRDEIEAGDSITLSADEYKQLQAWRKALRAITADPNFPNVELPTR